LVEDSRCVAGLINQELPHGLSAAQQPDKARQDRLALEEGQARLMAVVSNIPGMVFEMEFSAEGTPAFTAISLGSRDLFHTTPELLMQEPDAIGSRVVPEDLASFMQSRQAAFLKQKDWNWGGRIRVAEINAVKWIDLRSRVRQRADASTCWDGVVLNITTRSVADIKVRRAHEELARLTKHFETVKEQERSHIAREIHDELGGTLTAIKIMLKRMSAELTGAKALQLVQSTEDLVDSTIDITRRIATSLRPAILDQGILAAIEWQAAEFEKRTKVSCQVTFASTEIQLDHKLSIVVFRTFQEALTNIAKHANATRVEVELEADKGQVTLQIHDNGRGVGSEDLIKPEAFGILGMQERARSLGGQASVRRTRNGTSVMLQIPRVGSPPHPGQAPS
jgi:signal transduction histidine kinase